MLGDTIDAVTAERYGLVNRVVSHDEREGGLRRILNFGHTFGHALETETGYVRFLHGEAVSWGMRAATHLAGGLGLLAVEDHVAIVSTLDRYGPIPSTGGIDANAIESRLLKDKKTIQRRIHFVLPEKPGTVTVRSDVPNDAVRGAIARALAECQ